MSLACSQIKCRMPGFSGIVSNLPSSSSYRVFGPLIPMSSIMTPTVCGIGLATSPGTCAGTCGFIHGKTRANGSPVYESPGAYKTREYGCQFWITRNPYGLPVQPVYTLVSIRALQQQQGAWAVSKMKWDENRTRDGKFRPDNVNH